MLEMGSMQVGDRTIDTMGARGIVDSGTSLLVGPPEIISEILPDLQVDENCDMLRNGQLKTLKINMKTAPDENGNQHNVAYELTPEDYVMNRDGRCKTGIAVMKIQLKMDNPIIILGDTFLRKYYSVFDHEKNQVGFAKANHNLPQ